MIEAFYEGFFCRSVKVDHDIPAEDKVKFPFKTDGIHQIKRFEDDILP